MKDLYRNLIESIGEDPDREGLLKTPERAAKAFEFLTKGMNQDLDAVVNKAVFQADSSHMVIVKDIEFYSLCEHHMLPFFGRCHIGYLPGSHVLGVSKLARIADLYSRRLQIQERLTNQIAEAVEKVVHPRGVGVVMEGQHLCMMMRGVEKQTSSMVSSVMLGSFQEDYRTRAEFLELIGHR